MLIRPAQEETDSLFFGAEISGLPDGNELRGRPVFVLLPAIRESAKRQSEKAGEMMKQVRSVSVAFLEEIDTVPAVFSHLSSPSLPV